MPLNNIGKNHLTAAQKTAIENALQVILTELGTVTPNFSDEERKKYGSVNEQNKLIVNKVKDFHTSQPALQSPDVNWTEFELDFEDRSFADTSLSIVASITKQLSDFKIAHDYDNYQDALTDYSYAQYKAGTNTPGFSEKVNELKQFFSRTGTDTGSTEKNG